MNIEPICCKNAVVEDASPSETTKKLNG